MNSADSPTRGRRAGTAALLAALTFFLYLPAGEFEFLNYDDPDYVSRNAMVARGLSGEGLRWAFGFHAANWHPLTWLSHMLDVESFGLVPGPMHLVNAGLHAANAALLFLALAALTRAFWPAVIVAALFAVHPLRVQSVAWIAERKDLLAGFFFFAALLAHERWARARSRRAYAALLACFALGLMAKPMLVTLPFVLLLLDFWPLARFRASAGPPDPAGRRPGVLALVLEKLPLLALAAAACVLTFRAQRAAGAVGELAHLALLDRVWTASAGVLAYLRATVWPSGLAAFYPHPLLAGERVLLPGLLGAAVVLAGSLLAWGLRRAVPPLCTGWFWFLGMLVPVCGLVQVGDQAWADRYAYLPTIGLYVALVFGLAEKVRAPWRASLAGAGLAAAALLALVTARTLPHWRDSRTLFERALAVTDGNWIAENNLGLVYLERREAGRARAHFEAAARIRPGFANALHNLGKSLQAERDFPRAVQAYLAFLERQPGHADTLLQLAAIARADGEQEKAVGFFEQALQANPEDARVWTGFAQLLLEQNELDRAANCAASALKLDPLQTEAHLVLADVALKRRDLPEAELRLGRLEALAPGRSETLALRGRILVFRDDHAGARAELERAVALDPTSARARYDLGTVLLSLGEREAARGQFQAVDDLQPGDPQAAMGLGFLAIQEDRPHEAIAFLEQALKRMPRSIRALSNLAAVHEGLGDWAKALELYQRAFEIAPPTPEAAAAAAWILATGPDERLIDGERALELATYAVQRQAPAAFEVLAAAHARAGGFDAAVTAQEQAIQNARTPQQRRVLEERLALYRAGQPYTRAR